MGRKDRSWVRTIKAIVAIAAMTENSVDETADPAERRRIADRHKRRDAKRRGSLRIRTA